MSLDAVDTSFSGRAFFAEASSANNAAVFGDSALWPPFSAFGASFSVRWATLRFSGADLPILYFEGPGLKVWAVSLASRMFP